MVITYHGLEFFRVQFGDTVVAFNPISKESKIKAPRFGADITLSTLKDPDLNGIESVAYGGKEPFAVTGPGEYEKNGVFIKGLPGVSRYGGETRINTVYSVELEGMKLCFLGAQADKDLPAETTEEIGDVDVLFVPIGGGGVLSPHDAAKLAVALEPKIVIPMHYIETGEKDALPTFLKDAGGDGKPLEKFTFKKKDIADKEGEVVVVSLS